MEPEITVAENAERARYEAYVIDRETGARDLAGVLAYDDGEGTRTLLHTVVWEEHAGHGIGGRLATRAFDDADDRGVKIVPVCTFVQGWLERHPERMSLVA
ncbi:GNAT family N-acetyltransferase [Microbacterium paludicola]|nr:GNAT family N-acetyltransferase [Microbacterium paludicola]MBF0815790.1 N-acetyltransferase [Microbacterium paludicola]